MLGRRTVTAEQGSSLASSLRKAGVEHGDTTEVELVGVGVKDASGPHLCFCPTAVRLIRTIARGSAKERRLPIPGTVSLNGSACRKLLRRAPSHGFVNLRATVHTNGTIHLKGVQITSVLKRPAWTSVAGTDSYALATANDA